MATLLNNPIYDPHLHLFYLDEGDYDWLKNGLPSWEKLKTIQKSFTESDLVLTHPLSLLSYTHIEAGFDNNHPENETAFLQDKNGSLHTNIGFIAIDHTPERFAHALKRFMSYETFVGIRDITEGTSARKLFSENVHKNLALLAQHGLIFEAQFEICQLEITSYLVSLVEQIPELTVVINHAGLVSPQDFNMWQSALRKIKHCPRIKVKYSGFEMLGMSLSDPFRKKTFDALVNILGNNQIMFASNFPVCLMESSYQQLWLRYRGYCDNEKQWKQLSVNNACKIYQAKC